MAEEARVLLVTGPGGSGKSTLAATVADRLGWAEVGEDEYWVANGWGSGLRSPEHERIVQQQVAQDVLAVVAGGGGVALELILYSPPPNPLTAYQGVLADGGIAHETVVLRPGVEEILRRMRLRGRPSDGDVERRRSDAEWQVALLEMDHIDPRWVIDPTGRSVDDLTDECITRLGLAPAVREGPGAARSGSPLPPRPSRPSEARDPRYHPAP